MFRRLPVIALTALFAMAPACTSAADLTGPDAPEPAGARFDEMEDNGGMFGNGNIDGEGDGDGAVTTMDNGGMGGSGDIVEDDAADNGGALGSGG